MVCKEVDPLCTPSGAPNGIIMGVLSVTTTENINICSGDHENAYSALCFGYSDHFVPAKHGGPNDTRGGGYPSGRSMVLTAPVGVTVK